MKKRRIFGFVFLAAVGGVLVWGASRPPKRPSSPRILNAIEQVERVAEEESDRRDAALIRQLLEENLDERRFRFGTVIGASSGCRVLPLDESLPSHERVLSALRQVVDQSILHLSRDDSPVRDEGRINEVSKHFENAIREGLDAMPGISCSVPESREGHKQRSGYPDLEVIDRESGAVFYIDPKLVAEGAWNSSFRTFYFEPKKESTKVTRDAVHLLIGIGHDGNDGVWKFGPARIVDLSKVTLRLKPEFQGSNADLYPGGDDQ